MTGDGVWIFRILALWEEVRGQEFLEKEREEEAFLQNKRDEGDICHQMISEIS